MIAAGKLDTRINIESRSSSQDDVGQPIETWVLVAVLWASVRHISGVAAIKAGTDSSTVKTSFRIRYMAGIDSGMRILSSGEMYNITAVLPNRSDGYIDLVAGVIS